MSAISHIAAGETTEELRRVRFRASRNRAAADVTGRHATVSLLAFQQFDSRATALSYLNTHHQLLGGRPIDLAGQGADGLARVAADLKAQGVAADLNHPA